jgi:hypothetical protein
MVLLNPAVTMPRHHILKKCKPKLRKSGRVVLSACLIFCQNDSPAFQERRKGIYTGKKIGNSLAGWGQFQNPKYFRISPVHFYQGTACIYPGPYCF